MNDSGFVINDGVLVEYRGFDRDVIIPEGVIKISDRVFMNKPIESVSTPSTLIEIESSPLPTVAV